MCSLAPRFRHHQCKVRLTPKSKYLECSLSFSIYYLWLSPGNRYLIPGCDGKCFWKCSGRRIVHVAAPASTIFPLVTACTPGTLLLYGSHYSRALWVMQFAVSLQPRASARDVKSRTTVPTMISDSEMFGLHILQK